jgi:hypothetical protein
MVTSRQRWSGLTLAAGLGSMVLLGACGGEIRAERQGRQLGASICDIKSADSADDAQRQLDQAQRQMNDLQRIVGRPLNEDIDDIQENLSDLVEHSVNGNDALRQQDIAVIQRNVAAVARTLTGRAEAAYDGLYDGLGDCGY